MHKPRKLALIVLAGITAAGVTGASAASLGGLGGGNLGSDDDIVLSCDTDGVDISYVTQFNATTGKNMVTSVNIAGVSDDCDDQEAIVSLRNGTTLIGTGTTTVPVDVATTFSITLTSAADAELVDGVSLVIQG